MSQTICKITANIISVSFFLPIPVLLFTKGMIRSVPTILVCGYFHEETQIRHLNHYSQSLLSNKTCLVPCLAPNRVNFLEFNYALKVTLNTA